MWHRCQVNYKVFIIDLLANGNRQTIVVMLKLLGTKQGLHAHHLFLHIWNFNANCTFSRDWRDYPDTKGSKAKSDIIFQVFDPRDPNARHRHNLIQRYGWTNSGKDLLNGNIIVLERV